MVPPVLEIPLPAVFDIVINASASLLTVPALKIPEAVEFWIVMVPKLSITEAPELLLIPATLEPEFDAVIVPELFNVPELLIPLPPLLAIEIVAPKLLVMVAPAWLRIPSPPELFTCIVLLLVRVFSFIIPALEGNDDTIIVPSLVMVDVGALLTMPFPPLFETVIDPPELLEMEPPLLKIPVLKPLFATVICPPNSLVRIPLLKRPVLEPEFEIVIIPWLVNVPELVSPVALVFEITNVVPAGILRRSPELIVPPPVPLIVHVSGDIDHVPPYVETQEVASSVMVVA